MRFFAIWRHKLFCMNSGVIHKLELVDGLMINFKKCSKCGITITFTVGGTTE